MELLSNKLAYLFSNPQTFPLVCIALIYLLSKSNTKLISKLIWSIDSDTSPLPYIMTVILSLTTGACLCWGLIIQQIYTINIVLCVAISVAFATLFNIIFFAKISQHKKRLQRLDEIAEGLIRYANANTFSKKQLQFVSIFISKYKKGYCLNLKELSTAENLFYKCEKKHGFAYKAFKEQQEEEYQLAYQQAYNKYFDEHPELFKETKEANPIDSALSLFMFDNINEVTEEELKKRYRKLQKSFHPDNGGESDLSSKINEAYDLLRQYT